MKISDQIRLNQITRKQAHLNDQTPQITQTTSLPNLNSKSIILPKSHSISPYSDKQHKLPHQPSYQSPSRSPTQQPQKTLSVPSPSSPQYPSPPPESPYKSLSSHAP